MEVIKRGFEILKTRPLIDQIDIAQLEQTYNVKIPSKYRLFAELFYLNIDLGQMDCTLRYLPENNPVGDEIFFDNLFSLESCLESYEEFDFWQEKGYMQIGDGPPDGGILLCMGGEEGDSIIYNYAHDYVKLASNVFDFFRDVVVVENK